MKIRQDVYDTYWKTAAERQEIFFRKLKNLPPPYTTDSIYQSFKFCNVYRASDRVSQFLIKNVIYSDKFTPEDTIFRIFLFRLLNKIETLRSFPLIGNFMAYQIATDFNYSEVFDFDENDFTVAGPGAERGIRKCFIDTDGKSSEYIIQYMVKNQDKEFERLGIKFRNLWGRPMHAIDCQGWFCETDKYSRVKFPKLKSNRVRIKANYKPTSGSIEYFYPPKWKLNLSS